MNHHFFQLLYLLRDGLFHSITSLSNQLNCSRPAIVKAFSAIQNYDIEIDIHKDYGYRCTNPINFLNRNEILRFSQGYSRNFDLQIFDVIDSTNNYLLNHFDKCLSNNDLISVVSAEIQTNGRGRIERSWYSGLGNGLTFSLLWRFEYGVATLTGLSLVIGIAVVRVLRSFSSHEICLKWPNDVLYDNCKLAGILVELRGKIHGPSFAVIGIGINFNLPDSIKYIIQRDVTDLFTITGKTLNRNEILGTLLIELRNVLTDFEIHSFSYFKNEWMEYHAYHGRSVILTLPNDLSVEGVVDCVNDDGSISLVTSTGKHSYNVGDISMRLIDQ